MTAQVSIRHSAVDRSLERGVFAAGGAADRLDLLQVVLGLEHVALFGIPHAVIGPGQRVVGIGGERAVVPEFGVVIAAEFAARIADQRRHIRIVVVAHGAQHSDAAGIIALVVDQRVSLVPALVELFDRARLVRLGLFGVLFRAALARRRLARR